MAPTSEAFAVLRIESIYLCGIAPGTVKLFEMAQGWSESLGLWYKAAGFESLEEANAFYSRSHGKRRHRWLWGYQFEVVQG